MKKYTFEDIENNGMLLYRYVRGSQVYGTALPNGKSDVDEGGVYLEPIEQVLGLGYDFQEEISDSTHDKVWYSLKKYLSLLCTSNPNILEGLFVPDEFVLYEHPIISHIKEHRQEFVTKECFNAFIGYSIQQIKRCRGLNKLITNEVKERLWPLDFCYVPYHQGSANMREWLKHRGLDQKYCGLVSLNNMPGCYAVFYDWGAHNSEKYNSYDEFNHDNLYINYLFQSGYFDIYDIDINGPNPKELWYNDNQNKLGYRGIVRDDGSGNDVRCSSVEKGVNPIITMSYNQNGYENHCRKYKEYQDWVKKRNPVRYESNLGHNYDSKNVMHSFRLLNMGIEIAKTGEVHVNRRGIDAEFLLDIRNHKYEYEYLIDHLEARKNELDEAIAKSTLPDTVSREFVNGLLLDIRKEQIAKYI